MKKFNIYFLTMGVVLLCGISMAQRAGADELIKVDAALRKIYKNATNFEMEQRTLSGAQTRRIGAKAGVAFDGTHATEIVIYTVYENRQIIGHALEDTVAGKWGPIHYLVGLGSQGAVLEVIVLDYQEIRGRPVAKRRFLRQYKGKTAQDPLQLREDIDGITGATISSRSLTDGVRKLLHIFEEIR